MTDGRDGVQMREIVGIRGNSVAVSGDSLCIRTPFVQENCNICDLIAIEYRRPSLFTNGCLYITTENNTYPVYFASKASVDSFRILYNELSSRMAAMAKIAVGQSVSMKESGAFALSCNGAHPMLLGKGRMKIYVLDDSLRLDYRATNLGVTIRYEDIQSIAVMDRVGEKTRCYTPMTGAADLLPAWFRTVIVKGSIREDACYELELKGKEASKFLDCFLSRITKYQDDRQLA